MGIKSILHPGIIEKLASHNGEEAAFPSWRFKFEGLVSLVGLDSYLQTALETTDSDLRFSVQTDGDMAARAKAIWYLLVQSMAARGTNIMLKMSCDSERCNGFIAWKRICADFQPQVGGRHNVMLTALLHPNWAKDSNFED